MSVATLAELESANPGTEVRDADGDLWVKSSTGKWSMLDGSGDYLHSSRYLADYESVIIGEPEKVDPLSIPRLERAAETLEAMRNERGQQYAYVSAAGVLEFAAHLEAKATRAVELDKLVRELDDTFERFGEFECTAVEIAQFILNRDEERK